MTEIKLMNYGRGAGKTYTLKQWGRQTKERLVVVPNLEDYKDSYLHQIGQVVDYDSAEIIRLVTRNKVTEIAFDDFKLTDPQHLFVLQSVLYAPTPKTVILATSIATVETEAAKQFANAEEWRRSQGFKTEFFGSPVLDRMNEAMEKVREPELEPIQSVKARDLCIGDWIVGKGHVFSISEAESVMGGLFKIYTEDKQYGFEGELKVSRETPLDVDITKRK